MGIRHWASDMGQLTATAIVTAVLAQVCLLIHYEALRLISRVLPALSIAPRRKILLMLNMALLAHVCEIIIYAAGFALLLESDSAAGTLTDVFDQAIYISLESYASLGTSSGFPVGPLRLLAGSEALAGLLLIGWTASYTYLAMSNLWDQH